MYRTIRTIHQYDMIHTMRIYVSNDSWALTIRPYDTKLFVDDMYHVSYNTDNYAPPPKTMLTRASVTILRSFTVSFNWSNKFFNLELFYKVVITTTGRASLSSSSSLRFTQITTTATPFPLWFRNRFLWTSSWDNSRVLSLILWCNSLRNAQHSAVGCCI